MESISCATQFAAAMQKVCEDRVPIAITRKGEAAMVMISMGDYQALAETAYLLRSPKNLGRLVDSIIELEEDSGRRADRAAPPDSGGAPQFSS
jgi:antitoxin YefM